MSEITAIKEFLIAQNQRDERQDDRHEKLEVAINKLTESVNSLTQFNIRHEERRINDRAEIVEVKKRMSKIEEMSHSLHDRVNENSNQIKNKWNMIVIGSMLILSST